MCLCVSRTQRFREDDHHPHAAGIDAADARGRRHSRLRHPPPAPGSAGAHRLPDRGTSALPLDERAGVRRFSIAVLSALERKNLSRRGGALQPENERPGEGPVPGRAGGTQPGPDAGPGAGAVDPGRSDARPGPGGVPVIGRVHDLPDAAFGPDNFLFIAPIGRRGTRGRLHCHPRPQCFARLLPARNIPEKRAASTPPFSRHAAAATGNSRAPAGAAGRGRTPADLRSL